MAQASVMLRIVYTLEIRVQDSQWQAVPVAEEDMQEGVGPTIGDFAFYRMHFQQQNRCGKGTRYQL